MLQALFPRKLVWLAALAAVASTGCGGSGRRAETAPAPSVSVGIPRVRHHTPEGEVTEAESSRRQHALAADRARSVALPNAFDPQLQRVREFLSRLDRQQLTAPQLKEIERQLKSLLPTTRRLHETQRRYSEAQFRALEDATRATTPAPGRASPEARRRLREDMQAAAGREEPPDVVRAQHDSFLLNHALASLALELNGYAEKLRSSQLLCRQSGAERAESVVPCEQIDDNLRQIANLKRLIRRLMTS